MLIYPVLIYIKRIRFISVFYYTCAFLVFCFGCCWIGLDIFSLCSFSIFFVYFLKCSKSLEQWQIFCCVCRLGQGHTERLVIFDALGIFAWSQKLNSPLPVSLKTIKKLPSAISSNVNIFCEFRESYLSSEVLIRTAEKLRWLVTGMLKKLTFISEAQNNFSLELKVSISYSSTLYSSGSDMVLEVICWGT